MIRIAIVTVSDSAANGTREDRSGPKLRERVGGGFGMGCVQLPNRSG